MVSIHSNTNNIIVWIHSVSCYTYWIKNMVQQYQTQMTIQSKPAQQKTSTHPNWAVEYYCPITETTFAKMASGCGKPIFFFSSNYHHLCWDCVDNVLIPYWHGGTKSRKAFFGEYNYSTCYSIWRSNQNIFTLLFIISKSLLLKETFNSFPYISYTI